MATCGTCVHYTRILFCTGNERYPECVRPDGHIGYHLVYNTERDEYIAWSIDWGCWCEHCATMEHDNYCILSHDLEREEAQKYLEDPKYGEYVFDDESPTS